jgi:hypothetical protein
MKEGLVILVVILILLALTALRYRKQINSMIGVAKMLKEVKDSAVAGKQIKPEPTSVQLVSCAKCGVWVPQGKAIQRQQAFYCSDCR